MPRYGDPTGVANTCPTLDKIIDEEFECLGYFGFGSGVSMARDGRGAYCNGCPKAAACWQIHRENTKEKFPDLCQHVDQLSQQKHGQRKIAEFIKNNGVEPYTNTMMGNMQDGAYVVKTGKPKDRGEFTLPYPFNSE